MFNMLPPSALKVIYPMLYAFDAGNGLCKGLSGETKTLVEFEPVVAPMTDQRALIAKDEKPTFSLISKGRTEVFGIDDVFAHGKRTAIRRFNSQERYTSQDYFHMIDVLFHARASRPTGTKHAHQANGRNQHPDRRLQQRANCRRNPRQSDRYSVPSTTLPAIRSSVELEPDRLLIVPESYGALMHYAYDAGTLRKRDKLDMSGTTLVVDIGYETTDMSLFEGLHYQRDRTESEPRAGMGVISRALQNYIRRGVRNADVSRIDRAMQKIAGIPAGEPRKSSRSPAHRRRHRSLRRSRERSRAAYRAGSADALPGNGQPRAAGGRRRVSSARSADRASRTAQVVVVPNPELANVLGGFTMLNIQAMSGQFLDQSELL